MVEFKKFFLDNGLTVIFHYDNTTPLAAVNILYKVGSRDEKPDKTGFAHLFEHLMFEGSKHVASFDYELEMAGGTSNAFTNYDFTNYYLTIPKENIETALWLESDRMLELDFSETNLKIQKGVVIEEFKETVLNKPYGDDYKLMLKLAYTVHPYRWPVIGEDFSHIQKATLKDVKDFFYKYYAPNNAILTIAGDLDFEEVKRLVHKWFDSIPKRNVPVRQYPIEPEQREARVAKVKRNVPFNEIMIAFPIFPRKDFGFYVTNIITDILATGSSSRLYRRLVKDKKIFSEIDAYVSGTIDPGLLYISGILNKDVKPDDGLNAIWEELERLKKEPLEDFELQKIVNAFETAFIYEMTQVTRKAMSLSFYEMLGDANLYNIELDRYRNISKKDVMLYSQIVFQEYKSNTLYYLSK